MLPEQKRAWFTVGVFAVACAAFLVLIPLIGVTGAMGGVGVCGLWGLTPLLFRRKHDPAEVVEDERDRMIAQRATLGAGIAASAGAVVLACMVPWAVYMFQGKEVITVHALPGVVWVETIVFGVTRAIAILVQYGREPSHVED